MQHSNRKTTIGYEVELSNVSALSEAKLKTLLPLMRAASIEECMYYPVPRKAADSAALMRKLTSLPEIPLVTPVKDGAQLRKHICVIIKYDQNPVAMFTYAAIVLPNKDIRRLCGNMYIKPKHRITEVYALMRTNIRRITWLESKMDSQIKPVYITVQNLDTDYLVNGVIKDMTGVALANTYYLCNTKTYTGPLPKIEYSYETKSSKGKSMTMLMHFAGDDDYEAAQLCFSIHKWKVDEGEVSYVTFHLWDHEDVPLTDSYIATLRVMIAHLFNDHPEYKWLRIITFRGDGEAAKRALQLGCVPATYTMAMIA